MKEIKILIRIDEKSGIKIAEDVNINFPLGIDRELYLHGIYGYLWAKSCKKFGDTKRIFRIEK